MRKKKIADSDQEMYSTTSNLFRYDCEYLLIFWQQKMAIYRYLELFSKKIVKTKANERNVFIFVLNT
jgi:hypothetical protein